MKKIGDVAGKHESPDSPKQKMPNKPSHHTVDRRTDAAVNVW